MATSKQVDGPTPNGGVRSEALYLNDQGQPADETVATRVEILEYDQNGRVIHRTYGTIPR